MLGCTPATPEFPMLSVCNNPRPTPPPQPTSSSPQCRSPFSATSPYISTFLSLSIPSLLFLHFHSCFSALQFLHLPQPPPSLSVFLVLGLFVCRLSPSFLSCHTNKRAGMVRGLKLNNLCPTTLNTQTGCSQNIKTANTKEKEGGRA